MIIIENELLWLNNNSSKIQRLSINSSTFGKSHSLRIPFTISFIASLLSVNSVLKQRKQCSPPLSLSICRSEHTMFLYVCG